MTTIEFDLIDLANQKFTEKIESRFELHPKYLKWVVKAYADVPINVDDKTLGWKNEFICFEEVALRHHITGVGKAYCFREETGSYWRVWISIEGYNDDMTVYFKRESNATKLHNQILEYILKRS